MYCHAPIMERKEEEAGVRELARLENAVGGGSQVVEGPRSWDSMRASLRVEVMGDAPGRIIRGIYYEMVWRDCIRRAVNRLRPAGPPPTQTTS